MIIPSPRKMWGNTHVTSQSTGPHSSTSKSDRMATFVGLCWKLYPIIRGREPDGTPVSWDLWLEVESPTDLVEILMRVNH